MDWSQVTVGELWESLQEVDWAAPRPLGDFFSKFTLPKNEKHLISRIKCNLYYYRTNYLVLFVASFAIMFLRNPPALVALAMVTLALLCLNDPFATSLNATLLKLVRRVSPHLAMKARAKSGDTAVVGTPRRGQRRKRLYILLVPRRLFVGVLFAVGAVIMYYSRTWLTLCWAILFGVGLPLAHTIFRSPNLKARIANAREEFKVAWRGYQAELLHDFSK